MRAGAGRKPKGPRALVSHKARPRFEKAAAVHVTLRVGERVWNLRSRRCFTAIEAALEGARERFGVRIIDSARHSRNGSHRPVVHVADAYGHARRITLNGDEEFTVDTRHSGGWYDIALSTPSDASFGYHLAGRLESRARLTSDPQLGRP